MKTYLANIIPRIRKFSKALDDTALLADKHWVVIDELTNSKFVYIFRGNNELLISRDGRVSKGKWEFLDNNSILLERDGESFLFRHGFFDESVLALKVDGKNEFAFLINENRYGGDLNSIDKVLGYLETKYLRMVNAIPPSSSNDSGNVELKDNEYPVPIEDEHYKCGYANSKGQVVISCKYTRAYHFKEGLGLVWNKGPYRDFYGFINASGLEVISLKYEFAESFNEGLALVKNNEKFGFIDKTDKVVHPFIFDDADSFKNGHARVRIGQREYFIDKKPWKKP